MALTSVPPPPRIIRPVLHAIWPLVAVAVTALALPVLVVGCVQALFDRKARLLRVTALAVLLLWVDVRMLVGCWRLWLASPGGRSPTWREDHEDLFERTLDEAMALGRRWVGFRVELTEPMWLGSKDAPMIAFARHAGPADSIAIAWLLKRNAGRLPRIVLAEALRWDPSVDMMLTRLQSYFVPSSSGAGEDKAAHVAALAESMGPDDVLLLFPEGQNWSPQRRSRLIDRLRAKGDVARARRAETLRHTLPPRFGGVIASITARPDADVMVLAHSGFGELTSPRTIYDAVPFTDRPFLVRAATHHPGELPTDPTELAAWIDAEWTEMDEWIATEHAGFDDAENS